MVGFAILGYPTYSITHDTFVNSKEIRIEVMYKISGRMEKTKYFFKSPKEQIKFRKNQESKEGVLDKTTRIILQSAPLK